MWKTPIGAHQAVSHPLAKAKIDLELARLMTQKAAALFDARANVAAVGEDRSEVPVRVQSRETGIPSTSGIRLVLAARRYDFLLSRNDETG